MSDRCLECHTEIGTQLADQTTLHGSLEANNCRDCHVEHRGAQGPITEMAELLVNHEQFGFSLAAHKTTAEQRPFACTDCHTASLTRFEASTCETCHRDRDPDFTAFHVRDFGNDYAYGAATTGACRISPARRRRPRRGPARPRPPPGPRPGSPASPASAAPATPRW